MKLFDIVAYTLLVIIIISAAAVLVQIYMFHKAFRDKTKLLLKVFFVKTKCWLKSLAFILALSILFTGYLCFTRYACFDKNPSITQVWDSTPVGLICLIVFTIIILVRHAWVKREQILNTKSTIRKLKIAITGIEITDVLESTLPYIGTAVDISISIVSVGKSSAGKKTRTIGVRIISVVKGLFSQTDKESKTQESTAGKIVKVVQEHPTGGKIAQKILGWGSRKVEGFIVKKIEQGWVEALLAAFIHITYLTIAEILLAVLGICLVYL